MTLTDVGKELRDRYLEVLLEATRPLQAGPDREVALEALIEAASVLRDRLRLELVELRQEQVE